MTNYESASNQDSAGKQDNNGNAQETGAHEISSTQELKDFLLHIQDKISDEVAAPIYSLAAINHILNLPSIYSILDNECKELARDIWLRIRQSGLQLRTPPMLFDPEEESLVNRGNP